MADQQYLTGGLTAGAASACAGDLTAAARLVYNNVYALTTADDTTTTLTTSSSPDVLLLGTGILQWVDLGDATTYAVGQQFRFRNATTEIVGIKNSDSTVWERLPPRWELEAVLVDNSGAAGTWAVHLRPNPFASAGLFLLDDFMGGAISDCTMGWLSAVSGAGSSAQTLAATVFTTGQGMSYVTTGTTTTGYAQIYTRSSLLTTNCVNSFRMYFRTSSLSTVAEEYILRLGFGDSTDMSDHTDGMYFEYDRLTNGDFWSINTAAAGVRTETALGTPVADNAFYGISIESASDASRVDYWIGKVHVGTITTNIPGVSDSFGVHAGIIKSAGTTARYFYGDYIALGRYPTTERA